MSDIYVVDILRTPVGKSKRGVFKHVQPVDLLVQCMKTLMSRHPSMDWQKISDVVIGCAMPEAEQGMNIARIATLVAGLPNSVPAMTLNRFCTSGLQSIASAVASMKMNGSEFAMAGGVESMSMVPLGGNSYSIAPSVFDDEHVAIAYGMGITAEKVAEQWHVTREEQDLFALESHKRAIEAQKKGYFKDEIAPVEVIQRWLNPEENAVVERTQMVTEDEGPRADTTYEAIAGLKPVFALKGSVTAGNSSQTSDGAGICLLASEDAVKKYNLKPMAKMLSFSVAGVPPEIMGIGPIKAIPMALEQAGLTLDQMDWIELNEAFAAQSLAVIKELKLPKDKVNPLGGAIALGHPLGATGTIRAATVIHGLRRIKGKYGMVTMCIGTGMGAAAVFEALY